MTTQEKKQYYRFTELIEKFGLDRDDLIYRGESGTLPIYLLPVIQTGAKLRIGAHQESNIKRVRTVPHLISRQQFSDVLHRLPLYRLYGAPSDFPEWLISKEGAINQKPLHRSVTVLDEPHIFTEADLVVMVADIIALREEDPMSAIDRDEDDETIFGMEELKLFFYPTSWNIIKNWIEGHVRKFPGHKITYKIPLTDAWAIKKNHSDKYTKK